MSKGSTIEFTVGSRRLVSFKRDLCDVGWSLDGLLSGNSRDLGKPGRDGWQIMCAPEGCLRNIKSMAPNALIGNINRSRRHYIAMEGGYDAYLSRFSGKTRSTLRRKRRKLEQAFDGGVQMRSYHAADELEAFFAEALPLSGKTYQAKYLDAGLPENDAFRREAKELAEQDRLRAFLLMADGKAIAYLYLWVDGQTLVYQFLGYDPQFARLSPGTVLQMMALEQLFAEERFQYFDFTEGEGAHKSTFGTDYILTYSFLLLKPTLTNRLLLRSIEAFNGTVALAKRLGKDSALLPKAKALLRR